MNKFMVNHKIYLTPISPIHIGCGEDFEPTNYIVDGHLLYHFEPSRLGLKSTDKLFQQLYNVVKNGSFEKVKDLFIQHKNFIMEKYISDYQTIVPNEFQNEWETKNIIQNKLEVERCAYLKHPFNQVYIPGSSFKGALATAILDYEYSQDKNLAYSVKHNDLLKKYIGIFKDSELRYVKFSDFIPTHRNVLSKVFYALNFEKYEEDKGCLSVRRESIIPAQYRSFKSELTLIKKKDNSFSYEKTEIIRILNRYYHSVFNKEMELLLDRGLVNPKWFNEIKKLISDNKVALIRLGKNGSDSKVYQDKKITHIKVKESKTKFVTQSESTTIWLAKESTSMNTQIAFGWALLEFDTEEDNATLFDWCNQQPKIAFNREEFLEEQQKVQAEAKTKRQTEEAERLAKEAERIAKEQAEASRMAALSENCLVVEAFIQKHQNAEVKQHTDSIVFREAKQLIEKAISENWNSEDKAYLAENLQLDSGILKQKVTINSDKAKKEFKKLLNKLGTA